MKKKKVSEVDFTPYVKRATYNSQGLSGTVSYDMMLANSKIGLKYLLLCPLNVASFFTGIIKMSAVSDINSYVIFADIVGTGNQSASHKITELGILKNPALRRVMYNGIYYAACSGANENVARFRIMMASSSHEPILVHADDITENIPL